MVATAETPFDLVIGEPWKMALRWRDPDGIGIDLTGKTIEGNLRHAGADVVLTVGNSRVVVVNAALGEFEFRVTDTSVTAAVPEGEATSLTIKITNSDGYVEAGGIVPIRGVTL